VSASAAPDFRVVSEHVARNPVARAVAKKRITDAVRDFQIRLYTLPHGERVQADALAAAKTLAVAMGVLTDADQLATVEARIISGGMSALAQLSQRAFAWRAIDATAIDLALHHALTVYTHATAQQINAAHRRVTRLEQEAPLCP
jgi:hypothetical protein